MKAWTDYIWVWVWCLIVNDKNEILLLRRGKKCNNEVWYWGRAGWTVNFMEKAEDALKREVKEEIWVDIEIIQSQWYADHFPENEKQHWISLSFIAKITWWEIINLEPNKCDEIRWFSLDNLPELISPNIKDSIDSLRAWLNLWI
ncbi:MAG: MutT/nudix family protein [uncultured bacterium (gcode 4)]|uniref:MutT/nudix family protein n=1 Tax=uncultured bacterium (gcode 4) TaxID=1234023 RepID=K2G3J6_9BACT|nr:MAG: MutT/nudix family protein [uncultured bacterium (gcode 4)]